MGSWRFIFGLLLLYFYAPLLSSLCLQLFLKAGFYLFYFLPFSSSFCSAVTIASVSDLVPSVSEKCCLITIA